jgi:hypothetical protein
MKELHAYEFVWLLHMVQKSTSWEHKRIASRFIVRTLEKQRTATDGQKYLLRHSMISPFKHMI